MAREEAARLHHEHVGTEHILLGLIREGAGVGVAVLTNLNVDLEEIQQKIEETVKKGEATAAGPDLPYTSRAKKALELAMSEARELNHSYVGTEHLLLGLLREKRGMAAQVLTDAGVNLKHAEAETLQLLGSEMPDSLRIERRHLRNHRGRRPPQPMRDSLDGTMSQRQLASVLFAVLGAYLAIASLPQIFVSIGLWVQSTGTSNGAAEQASSAAYAITFLVGVLIAVLLGIVLVLFRARLAERFFPADTRSLAAPDTQAVALSVLGCYFVVESISRLVGRGRIDWSAVTQLVLGVGLFLGARGVARLWAAARSAGSSSSNDRTV